MIMTYHDREKQHHEADIINREALYIYNKCKQMWGPAQGVCIWLQSRHESPDHFMVAGGRLVLPGCGAVLWLAEQKHMFFRVARTEDL